MYYTKTEQWLVMYLYVRGIVTKPVSGQESDWSCICVLGVSLPSQESYWSCICVLGVSLPNQESDWSCICVLGYRYQAHTKPGKWLVMYLCVKSIVTKPVPSQESDWSCICVLGVSLPSLYQARKVIGHVYVC